jgi:hypothetical protein
MCEPDTLYARYGSSRIAYQVLGEGPIEVIATSASFGSMDAEWDNPEIALSNQRVERETAGVRRDGDLNGAPDISGEASKGASVAVAHVSTGLALGWS